MMRTRSLLLLCVLPSLLQAQLPGTLDPSFGTAGVQVVEPGTNAVVMDVGITSNGSIMALVARNDGELFFLQRRHANGALDNTYGTNGTFLLPEGIWYEAIMLLPDDRTVLVGTLYLDAHPYSQGRMLRVLPNGGMDPTFGSNGMVQYALTTQATGFYDLAQGPGGTIWVCGSIDVEVTQGGTTGISQRGLLLRAQANGALDPTFAGTGHVTMDHASETFAWTTADAVEAMDDGRVVVGGYTMATFPQEALFVSRFNGNGTPDNTFAAAGTAIIQYNNDVGLLDLGVDQGGKIILAGATNANGGEPGPQGLYLARLLANGQYDTGFGDFGIIHYIPENEYTWDAKVQLLNDGSAVVLRLAGASGDEHLFSEFMHLLPNGTFDAELGNNGHVSLSVVGNAQQAGLCLAIEQSGGLLIGGATSGPMDFEEDMTAFLARFHGSATSIDELEGRPGMKIRSNWLLADGEHIATLSLPAADPVRVRLLDVQGRERALLFQGTLPAGHSQVSFNISPSLGSGTYVLEATSPSGRSIARCVRLR